MSEIAPAAGSQVWLVLSTVGDRESAEQLGRSLVEERLIACANLLPGLHSIYRWEGAIQSEGEVLLVMKTNGAAVERLVARVEELHPYDVPEVVCLPAAQVADAYRRWVLTETAGAQL